MDFDPDTITQNQLQDYRSAAETAWGDDTRHPSAQGHPQPSYGQCYVTSSWLQKKLGGHVGIKDGHYFWVSPDKAYIIDLTGDNTAYEPHRGAAVLQDEEDEPYQFEPEQLRHRPGPVIYTRADHPLYQDFRIKEHPEHPRATSFARRADTALAGKLPKQADGGGGAGGAMGDAFPGQEPQAEEDFNQRYFHDDLSDLQLSMEAPQSNEYRWFYGNGQLHVSPVHNHDELRDHSGTPANHSGPIAAGFVNVQGRDALWSAESNVALRGLKRILEDYGKAVGWKWGGLVGGDGQSLHDDFGPKKSYWYGWKDGVQISERPFHGAIGQVVVRGHRALVGRVSNKVHDGLAEWASDSGFKLAEYPGGSDMTDRVKTKEWPELFDKGNPDKEEASKAFEGVPKGELTCPYCKTILPNFRAYQLHTQGHQGPDTEETPDGHFPAIEDKDTPLQGQLRHNVPVAVPLASFREASRIDGFDDYASLWGYNKDEGLRFYGGYVGGQLVGYGVVRPAQFNMRKGDARFVEDELGMIQSSVPKRGVGLAIGRKILQHYPNLVTATHSSEGERLAKRLGFIEVRSQIWKIAAGQEAKDLIQAPLPFVFDIKEDYITVGHPGQKTSDIMGQFTPGGIVEGYYEPGGKVVITTTTTMPYSTYHLMQLWYFSHPMYEITSLELENTQGKKQKLAAQDVGSYIKTLTVADGAAWTAYQALRNAGGKVYVVGGAVRDALLNKEPKDIDFMVSGLPDEEVHRALRSLPGRVDLEGKRFGVYKYRTKGQEVEIALPRTDDYSTGQRRGQGTVNVDPNLSVEDDLRRRDFTANSMAVDLDTGRLIDPYGGASDIEHGILRTTHPDSFGEDPTRLVRALVASSRHGLAPDEQTRKEMGESAWRLDQESPDALKQQLDRLLVSPNPAGAIRLAHETGVLKHLFPELDNNFDFDQNNPHHSYSLGEHSLQVLDNVAQKTSDPDLRLAALLHDVGKPASEWKDPKTGESHYYPGIIGDTPVGADHGAMGANMAEARLRETFNYPVAKIRNVHNLITQHMWPAFSSPKGARKFLNKQGDAANDLLTLREADMTGKGQSPREIEARTSVDRQRELVEEVRGAGVPTSQSALSVNGDDLISLGLRAGPQIGTVLRQLTNDVIENPALNERDSLLQRAQEYVNTQPDR